LLTTKNPQAARDANLLERLGIKSRLNETHKSPAPQSAHP